MNYNRKVLHIYLSLQCKEVRNNIQHSPKQELDTFNKDDYLNKIEDVLHSIPKSNCTTAALTKISDVSNSNYKKIIDLPKKGRVIWKIYRDHTMARYISVVLRAIITK